MTFEEFETLIEEQGSEIYSFCCYLSGNRTDADDIYQETMLKAMAQCENIETLRNPKSFLLGIAIGVFQNEKRKSARRMQIAPQVSIDYGEHVRDSSPTPEEAVLTSEIHHAVREMAAALNRKLRLPVYLYYSMELSVEEIASLMHIPKGTVKSRLSKARDVIRKQLKEQGYEGR